MIAPLFAGFVFVGVGDCVGDVDGAGVGDSVGVWLGVSDGAGVGDLVGVSVGDAVTVVSASFENFEAPSRSLQHHRGPRRFPCQQCH